jgi:hypothetical protein
MSFRLGRGRMRFMVSANEEGERVRYHNENYHPHPPLTLTLTLKPKPILIPNFVKSSNPNTHTILKTSEAAEVNFMTWGTRMPNPGFNNSGPRK